MNIISIEPTPSPNSMKVNLDVRLPDGERRTYTTDMKNTAPAIIGRLLAIPGVAGVFHTADFMAVDREPKANWQTVLQAVRLAFEAGDAPSDQTVVAAQLPEDAKAVPDEHYGEASVFVQKFRGIPLQIRVRSEDQEERAAMPQRFIDMAMQAQFGSPNLIKERVLEDYGIRYGTRKEIAEQVMAELEATFDEDRLKRIVAEALSQPLPEPEAEWTASLIANKLDDPDWKNRYAALEKLHPSMDVLSIIEKAISDSNFSIRRLATVYLGDIKEPAVYPLLYRMLRDPSASVRRTAGDCLSDIGDPDAIMPMCEALGDSAKIVRWRAARFLYEVGDETALPALHKAVEDTEFEVRMQVQYAIARIEGGEAATGSVWQQMTRRDR